MPKDTLIRTDLSPVDEMYIVHSGRALVFGRRTVAILSIEFRTVNDVIGDDVCTLLVGDRDRRRRHYTARAMTVLQVYLMGGETFREIVESGSFDEFKVGSRRYGCFLRIQRSLILHARARLRGTVARSSLFSFADQAEEGGYGAPAPATSGSGGDTEEALADDPVLAAAPKSRFSSTRNIHVPAAAAPRPVFTESPQVLSALDDVHDDIARLKNSPAAVRLHFASANTDLAALAPNFADIKRRVVSALGFGHHQLPHNVMRGNVVDDVRHDRGVYSGETGFDEVGPRAAYSGASAARAAAI